MKEYILSTLGFLAFVLIIPSCRTYDQTAEGGKFHGEPRMVPVTPNTFFFYRPKDKGDVLFSFEPGERSRFRNRFKEDLITPDAMLTTGASVPRGLWTLSGLSPFDYTRAALIHDWLFEAKHRYDIGKWLQQNGVTEAARVKGVRLERDYAVYGTLTQDEAAEIYGECIRAIMDQGITMKQDLTTLIVQNENPQARGRLEELRESLKPAKKSNFWLNAHRWFTSEGCWVPTAKKTWEAQHDDLGLYELLARDDRAVKKGYMSPWLHKKFQAIYKEPGRGAAVGEAKLAGVEAAVQAGTEALKNQAKAGTLRPRIYLEVEDARSQDLVMSHSRLFPGVDLKPDRNYSSLGTNILVIYYYDATDKAGANAILDEIKKLLPLGKVPGGARTVKLNDGGLYRPKHYDLHISSDVAQLLAP